MKKNIYVICDEEADELLPPFFANNDELALRMVKNSIKAHQFKNLNLEKLSLFKIISVEAVEGCVYSENHNVELIAKLNTLVDSEVTKQWDNEILAQSLTKCFEMALTKFLNDNKKE